MRLPWPFGRSTSGASDSTGSPGVASDAPTTPAARADGPVASTGAWRTLPPIQRTAGPPPVVAPAAPFLASVPGHTPLQPIVTPLGHDSSPSAPAGIVVAHPHAVASLTSRAPLPTRPVSRQATHGGARIRPSPTRPSSPGTPRKCQRPRTPRPNPTSPLPCPSCRRSGPCHRSPLRRPSRPRVGPSPRAPRRWRRSRPRSRGRRRRPPPRSARRRPPGSRSRSRRGAGSRPRRTPRRRNRRRPCPPRPCGGSPSSRPARRRPPCSVTPEVGGARGWAPRWPPPP